MWQKVVARAKVALVALHVNAAVAFLVGLVSVQVSLGGDPIDLSRPAGWFDAALLVLAALAKFYQVRAQ